MPQSVIAKYRRPAPPRRAPSAPTGRSIWFWLAVIALAAPIGVIATDLIDPGERVGAAPGGAFYFAATFGFFLFLFAIGAALLSAFFDVVSAWERSTPESERRSGDGGFLDLLGFGDGDGDCGGGDGGGD